MSYIDDVFGPTGLLAAALPGYKVRAGQVELARSIDTVLGEGGVLLAEAPTATGKSLAYGVPAAWHAAHNARRVVIVTANIALQEQLVGKDLPLLARVLPWPFTFALAKGINNYLCNDRLDEATADLLMSTGSEGAEVQTQWAQIVAWAARTEKGDVSELPFEPLSVIRPRFTTGSDECLGAACPRKVGCHALASRQEAKRAQVVVTNYHLYFADLALKAQGAEGVLPPYDVAVLDEGHKAADIARDFYGSRTTAGALRWATRHLRGRRGVAAIDNELQAKLALETERYFRALGAYAQTDDYYARLRKESPVAWDRLVTLLAEAEKKLRKASVELPIPGEKKQELRQAADKCALHAASIGQAMKLEDARNFIYFIESQGDSRVALMSAPIVVADRLRADLFEKVRSVVVTSATLTTGGTFDFLRQEMGADGGEEMIAESPLDWEHQALLVLPGGIPEPNDKSFGSSMAEALLDVVHLARGRTLALFTSYRMLDLAHKRLLAADLPYRVLRQGEAPRLALLKAFKEDVHSVLLGTESFWTGVDVPGEACSVVCIDRLPFESPADPLIDAVCERDRNAFKRFLVPRAILAFRQGVGRLIRTESDRGVVVCFDRRVVDKGYGRSFLRSLPPMKQRRDLEAVREFLG